MFMKPAVCNRLLLKTSGSQGMIKCEPAALWRGMTELCCQRGAQIKNRREEGGTKSVSDFVSDLPNEHS